MVAVSPREFADNFDLYEAQARIEPIAVTGRTGTSGYFLSAEDYAEYVRIKHGDRKVYHIGELPDDLFQAMIQSRMDPIHDHLNSLLED